MFVSGQIALLPSSLTLAESLPLQGALAAQHADRIVKALAENTGSNWQGIPHLNIYWFCDVHDLLAMKGIQHLLKVKIPPFRAPDSDCPIGRGRAFSVCGGSCFA